jgi:hypothetical protein
MSGAAMDIDSAVDAFTGTSNTNEQDKDSLLLSEKLNPSNKFRYRPFRSIQFRFLDVSPVICVKRPMLRCFGDLLAEIAAITGVDQPSQYSITVFDQQPLTCERFQLLRENDVIEVKLKHPITAYNNANYQIQSDQLAYAHNHLDSLPRSSDVDQSFSMAVDAVFNELFPMSNVKHQQQQAMCPAFQSTPFLYSERKRKQSSFNNDNDDNGFYSNKTIRFTYHHSNFAVA